MGCCVSTTKATAKTPRKEQPNYQTAPSRHRRNFQPPSPPTGPEPARVGKAHVESSKLDPPVAEEESVKEVVLSETPVSKLPTGPEVSPLQTEKITNAQLAKKPEPEPEPEPELEELREAFSEVSLVSESCEREVSESFSYSTTTTTTVTEVKDDDEAVSKRTRREAGPPRTALHGSPSAAARRKRPNSGELAARRGRGRGHSPAAASRAERSAEKRSLAEREPGRVRTPQRGGGSGSGEASARRSRSPATRAAGGAGRGGVGRGVSKVTGRGGGRSVEGSSREGKEEGSNSEVGNSESLENPLVALECFIFV